jgi:hypothetical protein
LVGPIKGGDQVREWSDEMSQLLAEMGKERKKEIVNSPTPRRLHGAIS